MFMQPPADMAERHARMLAEFAEIALTAARELGASLSQAETPDEKALLMGALHRAGRALRQSVALEAKLVRDAARGVREAESEARDAADAQVQRRKDQLQATLKRLLWNEREAADAERLEPLLDELIEEDACFEAFLADPIETQIARLAEQLGVTPPSAHPREGGDPSPLPASNLETDPSSERGPACAGPRGEELEFDAAPRPERPGSG